MGGREQRIETTRLGFQVRVFFSSFYKILLFTDTTPSIPIKTSKRPPHHRDVSPITTPPSTHPTLSLLGITVLFFFSTGPERRQAVVWAIVVFN